MAGPFLRWEDVPSTERDGKVTIWRIGTERCWLLTVEITDDFVVDPQVHHSEQVVQVLRGRLQLRIADDDRALSTGEVSLIPVGTYHDGGALAPSRVFEINCPRDMDNLYEPELGERSPSYPPAGRPARLANGSELGSQHVTWSELDDLADASGVVTQTVVGDRVVVGRVTLEAGATSAWSATGEELVQVIDGAVRLRIGAEEREIDDDWVAIIPPGSWCEALSSGGATLLRVELAE